MKRGKRILAIVLSLSMLFVALPIHELQARTIEVPTTREVELFSDDFDSYSTLEDNAARKTALQNAGWRTVSETAAGYAVNNTYAVPYNGSYNLGLNNLSDATNWTNYVVEAELTFVSGTTKSGKTAAGIAGRLYDATTVKSGYDLIVIKTTLDATNATLRLRCDGAELVSKTVICPEVDTPFTLKLVFDGTVIKGYLNDGDEITHDTVNDETKYTSGYAGIRKQDGTGYTTSFDNFRVYTTQTVNQQEEVLYSLNGTAYSENGSASDNSCLYYDTLTTSTGYTNALGGKDMSAITNYGGDNGQLSVGGFSGHKLIPFAGITDSGSLKNYTISADFSLKTETATALCGVAAYTNGTVSGNGQGYELSVYNGILVLRNRKSGESQNYEKVIEYFPEYELGDTVTLSLSVVNNEDDTVVTALATIAYNGEEKMIGILSEENQNPVQGIPALRGYYPNGTTVSSIYTVDNILIEAVEGDINDILVEKFGFVSNVILNIGADANERNFNWQTNLDLDCKLQYGLKADMVEGAFPTIYTEVDASKDIETACGTVAHKATLENLDDDTEYVYRIVSDDLKSDLYYFSTGDMEDGFTFAFAGDPQVGRTDVENDELGWHATIDAMLSKNVDFMMISGDQVHNNNALSYNKFFYNKLAGLTTATIVGNHDNHAMYNDYFNMPNVSGQYGVSKAQGDYYFVYGNTLFMCLNTNNLHSDTPNKTEEDYGASLSDEVKAYNKEAIQEHVDFMSEVVEDHPEVIWKTVVLHQSIYSVSGHRNDLYVQEIKDNLEPALIDLDIDVVLMGHDHCYTRTYMMNGIDTPDNANGVQSRVLNSNGILYITADSASGNKYGGVVQEDYAAVTSNTQNRKPTFSVMNVTNNSYEIVTYYSDDLQELDRFTINKNVDVNNDGKSNANDIVEMRKILVGSSTITEYDFNEDTFMDVVDLVALKKYSRK